MKLVKRGIAVLTLAAATTAFSASSAEAVLYYYPTGPCVYSAFFNGRFQTNLTWNVSSQGAQYLGPTLLPC
jgi:hypothetical protein